MIVNSIVQAKVSEIFMSYQGEGPFAGSRQLFVRFYGCNLSCGYCDTLPESYKSFSKESLLGEILSMDEDYNELALTGGEPLLHADFLSNFLPLYRKHKNGGIYLETNGTLPHELEKVINLTDIISMDIKLPSSGENGYGDLWDRHREFLDTASGKRLIVKTVVTDTTSIDDIKEMMIILKGVHGNMDIVLQPVTPVEGVVKAPDGEMLSFFREYLRIETRKRVMILGQMHKRLGIR